LAYCLSFDTATWFMFCIDTVILWHKKNSCKGSTGADPQSVERAREIIFW
jgi:hypothetical protein